MIRQRIAVAALALSAAGFVGIVSQEGYRGEAYIPVPGDVPTIGYGETKGVKIGDKTDPVRALIRLNESANEYAVAVKRCAPVPMHQHEFDAYVSLAYNIGTGAFCSSTLARRLVLLDYEGACKEINKWVYFKGKKLPGLMKRRAQERAKCEGREAPALADGLHEGLQADHAHAYRSCIGATLFDTELRCDPPNLSA